eukprot:1161221-Rhodomonas_salina.1
MMIRWVQFEQQFCVLVSRDLACQTIRSFIEADAPMQLHLHDWARLDTDDTRLKDAKVKAMTYSYRSYNPNQLK